MTDQSNRDFLQHHWWIKSVCFGNWLMCWHQRILVLMSRICWTYLNLWTTYPSIKLTTTQSRPFKDCVMLYTKLSLFHFPYITTYHSCPFILSKLFSQVENHKNGLPWPFQKIFFPKYDSLCFDLSLFLSNIPCQLLIGHCQLCWLWVKTDFFDSVVRLIPYQPATEDYTFQKLWRCAKESLGVWR